MVRLFCILASFILAYFVNAQQQPNVLYAFQIIDQNGEEFGQHELIEEYSFTISVGTRDNDSPSDEIGKFDTIHYCVKDDWITAEGKNYIAFNWLPEMGYDIHFVELKMKRDKDSMVVFYYGRVPTKMFVDSVRFTSEYIYVAGLDKKYYSESIKEIKDKNQHLFNNADYFNVRKLENYRPYRIKMQQPNGKCQMVISAPGTWGWSYCHDSIQYLLRYEREQDSVFCQLTGIHYDPIKFVKYSIAGMGEEIAAEIDFSFLQPGKYCIVLEDDYETTYLHLRIDEQYCLLKEEKKEGIIQIK